MNNTINNKILANIILFLYRRSKSYYYGQTARNIGILGIIDCDVLRRFKLALTLIDHEKMKSKIDIRRMIKLNMKLAKNAANFFA